MQYVTFRINKDKEICDDCIRNNCDHSHMNGDGICADCGVRMEAVSQPTYKILVIVTHQIEVEIEAKNLAEAYVDAQQNYSDCILPPMTVSSVEYRVQK